MVMISKMARTVALGACGVLAVACVAQTRPAAPVAASPVPAATPSSASAVAVQTMQASPTASPTPAPVSGASDAADQALFAATCSGCHELGQAANQASDRAGWSDTINRMIGYGATLTPAQADRLATYLAATHGPAKP